MFYTTKLLHELRVLGYSTNRVGSLITTSSWHANPPSDANGYPFITVKKYNGFFKKPTVTTPYFIETLNPELVRVVKRNAFYLPGL